MKTVEKIGRFTIAQNRNTFHLRWQDKNLGRQVSKSFGRDLEAARKEAYKKMGAMVSPDEIIERPEDPTFEELWHFYKREKKPHLSEGRARRLDELYKLYFKPSLAKVPASRLPDAIRAMRDRMLVEGWIGDNRDDSRGVRQKPLHPNTVEDIVNIARATLNFLLEERIIVGPNPVPVIRVAGRTAPIDREPKGRHVTLAEIGKLIDSCAFPHHRHMLLLDLGCASRSGVFPEMLLNQVLWDFDALDTLPVGETQTAKYKPVIPVTGPMRWAIAEAAMTAGPDNYLIHFRSQGLSGKNGTQIIHRIAKRALGETKAKGVNWYSIRHTLIDFLEMRVPARSLSMLAGHVAALDTRERRQFREHDGSATTLIYLRKKLEHLDPIRTALEAEWWPEIQKHCDLDLRLVDPRVAEEWTQAALARRK
jgi:hypothetical protein